MSAPSPEIPSFVRSKPISLQSHPALNEKWLENLIAKQPSLLNLGDDLEVKQQVKVPSGGILDLLLTDSRDGSQYAVEIQLGAIDPSHIIRTIEYWLYLKDDGSKRTPVLVAEDFTGRFCNVVEAFRQPFDLVAFEVQALELPGGEITLAFKNVFDTEEQSGGSADRAYWKEHASSALPVVDRVFEVAHAINSGFVLVYNRNHISVAKDGHNFLTFKPQKKVVKLGVSSTRTEELNDKAKSLGGWFDDAKGKYRFPLKPEEITKDLGALTDFLELAYKSWS